MTLHLRSLILICGVSLLLVIPFGAAVAKDRDKDDRRGSQHSPIQQPQQIHQPKLGGNLPGAGNNNPPINRQPLGGSGGQGNFGGGNQNSRKIELPQGQNQLGNPGGILPGQPGNRMQNNPRGRDNKPVFQNPNNNAGGGGGAINNPNLGGGQPVLNSQKDKPVLKRRDNDNKPGGGLLNKPNVGGNIPNAGGGQPIFKPRGNDNKPGGGVINNPNLGGNNPFGGNRNPGNSPPKFPNRNPDLKNGLHQFQPNVTKRQENEKHLLRNKDQVNQLLNSNPALKNKIQRPDGQLDLSRLHLEHGNKDRIPTSIHKNGNLPIKLDGQNDLATHFHQLGRAKNLNDIDQQFKHFQDPNVLQQHPELAKLNLNHASGRFQNNIVNVNNTYNNLVVSNVGKQLNLGQQYNLYQHGDVARQMNLNVALINHGGWQNRYIGPVYGGYTSSAFSFWYAGPGYYPSYCWCPIWSPWVDWTWWNTCLPIYDPRPLYCRPFAIYNPCPVWAVYPYPVWQPLPVVASGTWVDYTPVLVDNVDLQLIAVRFVDNGHPDQNLGTRYRVWLQNNSRVGIGGAFNVLLMASNTPDAVQDLPQAGVTIPSMEPGEMQAVDIRLPFAANKMNRVDNHLTPFNYLHVLVDSHRQLNDVNLANNGAVLPRADILPVDPAAFAPDVSAAAPGAMVSIAGEGFGPEPGRLIVSVNGVQTEATIYGWYDLGVQFELPNVAVNAPTDAEVLVVRGDGAASNPVTVRLAPENKLSEALLPPAPLP